MHSSFFSVVVVSANMTMASATHASPLDQYAWKNRVLVVVAPSGDPRVAEQRRIYDAAAKDMSERSIVLVDASGETNRARSVRSRLSDNHDRFRVYLIGKDGNTAVTSEYRKTLIGTVELLLPAGDVEECASHERCFRASKPQDRAPLPQAHHRAPSGSCP